MTYIPRSGDIGLTQIEGGVGELIRIGQWLNGDGFADYQHAFVVVGEGRLIEAMPGGAIFGNLWKYDHYDSVKYLRCPDEYRDTVAEAARLLEGVPYSFADYASLVARRLRISTPRLRAYIASSGHMICSQLADAAALRGGWHLFEDGRWQGDVTPGDLYGLYDRSEEKTLD